MPDENIAANKIILPATDYRIVKPEAFYRGKKSAIFLGSFVQHVLQLGVLSVFILERLPPFSL